MCFDTRMRSLAPADIALFIADDSNSQTKNLLRQSFRKLRHQCRPPEFTFGALTSVHDDMYFGDSSLVMAIRWDKFTVKAQEAVQRANELASEHGNPELAPLHLLARS